MSTIHEIVRGIEEDIRDNKDREETLRSRIEMAIETAKRNGQTNLDPATDARCEAMFKDIEELKASRRRLNSKLARAREVQAEEVEQEKRFESTTKLVRNKPHYDEVMRIGAEPQTYSRSNDPQAKGHAFLTDVAAAFRGNPQANERLARHMREYEVDHPRYSERAAGDTTSAAFPNLIVPQYLVNEYAAKPTAARPFADICRHVDLPAEGMKVELSKGNTSVTAALQTSELVAAGGGNFDADPLELSVQTAESWALVSRQSLERGRATEGIVLNDMLDNMNALIDSTLITQATTGLYASGTRITYDDAAPTVSAFYPYILQGASKSAQALLNKGKPTHVLMHPRRWYWMASLVDTKWPMIQQPGIDPQAMGVNNGVGYDEGIAGVLPCGLKVVLDANVQTAALAGADTGGTQDIVYVLPQHECVLLEAPGREVFIRAEAPAANQLAVMFVVYEYFAYTFSRYAATAFQRINGTGTVPPTGF
jgi:hypothetical protein